MDEFSEIEWVVAPGALGRQQANTGQWFWCELGLIGDRWSVSEHPFIRGWSRGRLSQAQLEVYAEEHEHLVTAAAVASAAAADKASGLVAIALAEHARKLELDVDEWHAFARAAGWRPASAWYYAADPFPATIACARTWARDGRSLACDLITLYSIEVLWGGVSPMLLRGLVSHYGFRPGAAVEYFRRRPAVAADRASLLRAALEGILCAADQFALLAQAEATHRSYWAALDRLVELSGGMTPEEGGSW